MTGPGPSLNPALEDVRFCPRCGQTAQIKFPRSITCAQCGYGAYYNPKPVACAIATDHQKNIVLMRRATEPSRGRWTMPGGFVDLGESVEEAAQRETREEVGLELEIQELVGVYSRSQDRIVVVVYAARATGAPTVTPEALEVRAFEPTHIPWQNLAFWSDERALRDFLSRRQDGSGAAVPS
jgi:ADP-ribose pyrophosphatase YjhB (NUDIX family)